MQIAYYSVKIYGKIYDKFFKNCYKKYKLIKNL